MRKCHVERIFLINNFSLTSLMNFQESVKTLRQFIRAKYNKTVMETKQNIVNYLLYKWYHYIIKYDTRRYITKFTKRLKSFRNFSVTLIYTIWISCYILSSIIMLTILGLFMHIYKTFR